MAQSSKKSTGKSQQSGSSARSQPRGERSKAAGSGSGGGREALQIVGSLLGILAGLLIIGISLGAWYLSNEAVGIMQEISSRDVSGPHKQVESYEKFFNGLSTDQFIVRRDEPRNLQNVITYLWTVEHRQSGEVTQFRWEWDMSTLDVLPRSNGALLLDRRLNNLKGSDLEHFDFYDPDDAFAMAIVQQDISLIGIEDMGNGWVGPEYKDSVLPPLISPEDALNRKGGYDADQKKQLEEELGLGGSEDENTDGDSNEPAVHVEAHPSSPPDGEGD